MWLKRSYLWKAIASTHFNFRIFFLLQASKIRCSFADLSLLCGEWRVSAKDMISLMWHLAMLCIAGVVICSFHLLYSVEGEPWFPSQDSHLKSGCCSALPVDTWCAISCCPWSPHVLLLDHSLPQGVLKFFVTWILPWKCTKEIQNLQTSTL